MGLDHTPKSATFERKKKAFSCTKDEQINGTMFKIERLAHTAELACFQLLLPITQLLTFFKVTVTVANHNLF